MNDLNTIRIQNLTARIADLEIKLSQRDARIAELESAVTEARRLGRKEGMREAAEIAEMSGSLRSRHYGRRIGQLIRKAAEGEEQ